MPMIDDPVSLDEFLEQFLKHYGLYRKGLEGTGEKTLSLMLEIEEALKSKSVDAELVDTTVHWINHWRWFDGLNNLASQLAAGLVVLDKGVAERCTVRFRNRMAIIGGIASAAIALGVGKDELNQFTRQLKERVLLGKPFLDIENDETKRTVDQLRDWRVAGEPLVRVDSLEGAPCLS